MRVGIDELVNLNFDDFPVFIFAFDSEQKSLMIVLKGVCLVTHPETSFDFAELEFFSWSSIEIRYYDNLTTEWCPLQVLSGCFIDKKAAILGYQLSPVTECPPFCSRLSRSNFHMPYIDETEVKDNRIILRGVCDFNDTEGKWTEITICGAQSHIHLESMLIIHSTPSVNNHIAIEIKRPNTSDAISEWYYRGKVIELNAVMRYLVNHHCVCDHSFDISKTCVMYSDLNRRGVKLLSRVRALADAYAMDSKHHSSENPRPYDPKYFILLVLFIVWLFIRLYQYF